MQNKVLVINAGSSSIKLQLLEKDSLKVVASGLAERITLQQGIITIKTDTDKFIKNVDMPNHTVAAQNILSLMSEAKLIEDIKEIEIIGFRVVHGGTFFSKTAEITDEVVSVIEKCTDYAPLHNPGALQAINAFRDVMPHAKLAAEFDTSFHTTIPDVNAIYPIPYEWSEKFGIRRFGFHGISHQFITEKMSEILNKDSVNIINAHIGNGASICAIKNSKSFDTTMGLTPLAGVMMGTRSGDVDPALVEFLCHHLNQSVDEVTSALNKKSGLLGVSGISSDMRDIEKAIEEKNPRAIFTWDLYVQKIVDFIANYANKVGSLDAIVFTAGVGENSPELRQSVIDKINFANIKLDHSINTSKIGEFALISTPDSAVKVYVIRTNEELLIAKNAIKLFN
ncbi:acetate/propionate family kinase [Mycoplasma zalophidermidis]|uniref:Acetate kinase n=1 Tax=Mycoplasma zalophidermidis TaxID=398174 RepID=A0ABS6DT90_9MOLU|nr:acetate/propionate family kinase [Mycoplasma zalophidermidis]MBU4689780.1 acetate/propionate family kinase [Mycoplasma zalophidermidis]MBU4693708.1 acetate/propionate family kinase [Mycoplasma zalophidermidis]MCR8966589.1 acetate/propionate family kinase [Mycoplasma zalophidermidis]